MTIGPVMMDIQGIELNEEDCQLLQHPLVGGLIFFSRNFKSVEQITNLTQSIRRLRPDIVIAVDQEGGRVQRFKEGFTRLPAMQRFLPLYRKNAEAALSLVKDCGWLMSVELLGVGVDFSFAPVLDVDDHQCEVIGDRSFSNDPEDVTRLAGAFIAGMHEAGMAVTGKHFPGHGSVKGDSHQLLPVDNRSYSEIEQHDLIPFAQSITVLDALMPAHIVFPQVDSASVGFSSYWLQTILREKLGFNGVIFSDDLSMEGAANAGGYCDRARAALQAGCDMILVCNSREGVKEVLSTMHNFLDLAQLNLGSSATRLVNMRASKIWTFAELIQNDRYRKTQAMLMAISGSGHSCLYSVK
jgi:beta-N-acetylhexosaminidase